ncbi:hypothetical protein PsorP6_009891 [Peronosclerospora sorghi]|uniref:Uncharacterized protein n=1 Tax=Peronosclerospora sorghi TaxID=230839 RepID=A0ACC0W071_9STRA|nr:hypothetical protein PsorP6_009891 [Peronosclerospora sorghi]
MHILAPEEKTYATYDELFTSVKSFGHTKGYTITTKTSSEQGRKKSIERWKLRSKSLLETTKRFWIPKSWKHLQAENVVVVALGERDTT